MPEVTTTSGRDADVDTDVSFRVSFKGVVEFVVDSSTSSAEDIEQPKMTIISNVAGKFLQTTKCRWGQARFDAMVYRFIVQKREPWSEQNQLSVVHR